MTKNLPSDCQILGVDRHGLVVETRAQLIRTREQARLAYVGTGAAVTALVTDTRLVANGGKRCVVKDLIEGVDNFRLQFETLVGIPDAVKPKPSIDELWTLLSDASAFRTSESVALRCRDSLVDLGPGSLILLKQFSGQTYAILTRQELARALGADWRETIISLTTCWLENREDARVEIERSAYFLALWFAMALTASGSGYGFQFDTIQHSSYVFVTMTHNSPRPIQPVASAFYAPCETDAISLFWVEGSVAPIAGGFLLASG